MDEGESVQIQPPKATYTCQQCERKFSTFQYLTDHIEIVHLTLRHECSKCLYFWSYTDRSSVIQHAQGDHTCKLTSRLFNKDLNLMLYHH